MEIEHENPFKLEELSLYTLYIERREEEKTKIKSYAKDGLKAHVTHPVDIDPRNTPGAVALGLNLRSRNVQKRHKARNEDPDSMFKKVGRPHIIELECELDLATKQLVSGFYFKYATATLEVCTYQSAGEFENPLISKATVYRYLHDLSGFTLKKKQLN
ncbi:hypothetical protein BDF14DRAFT_1877505 [Spinellus fusiger]|nr:hypothetical protein BDF14DRAFT_1877505 [Spinellus fusiger]